MECYGSKDQRHCLEDDSSSLTSRVWVFLGYTWLIIVFLGSHCFLCSFNTRNGALTAAWGCQGVGGEMPFRPSAHTEDDHH